MTVLRKLHRGAWIAAAAAVATLATVVTPASAADQPGILVTDRFSGKARTSVTHTLGALGTPLLQHFFFKYSNQDQHLASIGSLPGNALVLTYTDAGNNHEFQYDVAYHRVSSAGIPNGEVRIVCGGGVCSTDAGRPAGDFVFVLKGFKFTFTDGDHHIDRIQVIESGGMVITAFDDRNNDDGYVAEIRYAWVPRSRLGVVDERSNTVPASAGGVELRTDVPAGEKVIRGFNLDYTADDHHARFVGIETVDGPIKVSYGDKNPADSHDWRYRVQFAVLR